MADDVIISASLESENLTKAIDKLVRDVDSKLGNAAHQFEKNIGRMQIALNSLAQNASARVADIQSSFAAMGTTFQNFATAMERAARAAAGAAAGGNGGGGIGGSGGGGAGAAQDTIKWLKEQIELQKKKIDEQKLYTAELKVEVDLLAKQKELLKRQTTGSFENAKKNVRDIASDALSQDDRTIRQAQNKIYRIQDALSKMNLEARRFGKTFQDFLPQRTINALNKALDRTTEKLKKLQAEAAIPTNTQGVLGMSAGNLNEIQAKMAAIQRLRATLPVGSQDIKTLNIEYAKLTKLQDEILGKNMRLVQSNNALGRAFRYIANRLAFALSIGAVTGFVRQLYEVRGQYELLERSLGVLVNSFERGTQIFNELNEMAIKSPFTLIELGTAAKQLSAYNFAADEVVDTTKRLADISAALGVPMERLVYNLGQIKAQGVLNARDARDFANAGLAIVPMLAQMYTAEKRYGDQVVTTAQVYSMMSKKLVTYHDVLKVINQVTDEGGKFFDFQAKQAGTLKVQLANLTLAWNNMLNDIGTEQQATLTKPIVLLRDLFREWRNVERAIKTVIIALGTYKTVAFMSLASDKIAAALIQWGSLSKAIKAASAEMAIFNAISKLNPIGLAAGAIIGLIGYFGMFNNNVNEASEQVLMFGESASKTINKVETLYDVLKGTDKTSETYKKNMQELNEVLHEYGVETINESDSIDTVNEKRKEAIELIKLESAERERANNLKKAQERYDQQIEALRESLYNKLKNAKTSVNILGIDWVVDAPEIQQKARQIADITTEVVASNIDLVKNKTGKELEDGINKIFDILNDRMRAIGISENVISKEWLEKNFAKSATNIISDFVHGVQGAREAQADYNKDIENNYQAAKKAIKSTMTFTQKVEANARALRNNSKDAVELYSKVMDIVRVSQQNHVINFDLRLTAQNPPKWMFDKNLPELKKFAENFAAIAQAARGKGGANVNGTWFTEEQLNERALQYASAAKEKQYQDERKAQEELNKSKDKTSKKNKSHKKTSDELAESLKNEISIIKKLQSEYDKLVKAGVPQADALELIQNTYQGTLDKLNKTMTKFNLPKLDLTIIKGKDPNDVLKFFTNLRDILSQKGLDNLERIKAVDGVIEEFRVSAKTYNLEKITKGLNNELDKIKEEYELGVELEANPELGGVFADMMGISKDEIMDLPKDFQGVLARMQDAIDKMLGRGRFDLTENLNKSNFDAWVENQGNTLEDGFAQALNKIREYTNKVRLDETKKIISEWDKLLEKYSEYEYKRTQIIKEGEHERDIAMKHGASSSVLDAINRSTRQRLAKHDFDEFQKSATWITATGNLSNLADSAIELLIQHITEYKRRAKDLEPKEILKLNKALRQLRKEQMKNNPFKILAIASQEAKERAEEYDAEIAELQRQINELGLAKKRREGIVVTDEEVEKLNELLKKLKELKDEKEEASKIPLIKKLEQVQAYVDVFKQFSDAFKNFADSTNDHDMKKIAKSISDVVDVVQSALSGAVSMGGWWGAVIGGVVSLIPKILDAVSGNDDINYSLERSQLAVKRLTNAYKELEHQAEKAYGAEAYGTQKALIINKQLQLAELERQLALEKSRKGKYRDESAIEDLKGQIIDTKNEINDATEDIVNDLLGIASKGDFAENLVKNMINAFKEGEDYMKVFEDSFEDMVDNMIMKAIVSRLVGDWINKIWDSVNEKASQSARAKAAQAEIERLEKLIENYKSGKVRQGREHLTDEQIEQAVAGLEEQLQAAIAAYNAAITPTPEDIAGMRELFDAGREDFKNNFLAYMDAFGIKFGQSAGQADLSALQQGITNISETTAEALEAYMNSVSQQVYYQSDILTQIRDILVNFGGDITIATNAQILFELQQSTQIQFSIQSILQGWSSASGLAVRVELAN